MEIYRKMVDSLASRAETALLLVDELVERSLPVMIVGIIVWLAWEFFHSLWKWEALRRMLTVLFN